MGKPLRRPGAHWLAELPTLALSVLALFTVGLQLAAAQVPSGLVDAADRQDRYLAHLVAHTPEEIEALFARAEDLLERGELNDVEPIAFVLHGPEVSFFEKQNYRRYKTLVDKAARLDAFNVIDVRICETAMRNRMIDRSSLPEFVQTVPFGPAEEDRLRRSGYVQF